MNTTRARLRSWSAVVLVLVFAMGFAAACGDDGGGGGSATSSCEDGDTVIDTGDNFFEPKVLEVSVGTTVCWENTGRIHHNVVPDEGDLFGTKRIDPDNVYRFTFEEAGEYPYYCSFHGAPGTGQYGTVTVT